MPPACRPARTAFYPLHVTTPLQGPTGRRLYLHLGVPKSGTSFIQATLRENADQLRKDGFLFPASHHRGLFHAALELTGNQGGWGVPDARIAGTWRDLCAEATTYDGVSIFSNELFSNIKEADVAAALLPLAGLDVHVVLTARDLGRQLPAEWQEGIKHGRAVTFEQFLRRILDPARSHEHARRFWQHQGLPDIAARWAAHLPADHIHLVTCPPPGAPRELLWERFCSVVGLVPTAVRFPETGANTSLGVTAVDVLTRVNRDLRRTRGASPSKIRRTLKQSVVNGALRGDTSARVAIPPAVVPALEEIALGWEQEITRAGYDVVGDLADLRPLPPDGDATDPGTLRVRPAESRDLAVHTVAVLAREVAVLNRKLARAQARRRRAGTSPRRVTRTAVRRRGRRLRRQLRRGYRGLRGRRAN